MNELKLTLPKYNATESLQNGLIDYILKEGLGPGDAFFSDREVMRAAGRSRTAVRRALTLLQEEGWIERRGGVGTFIGARAEQYRQEMANGQNVPPLKTRTLRIAVVAGAMTYDSYIIRSIKDTHQDDPLISWYSGPVLQGFNLLSVEENFVVEIIGGYFENLDLLRRRLEMSSPDLLVCIGPPFRHFGVLAESRRLGLPNVLVSVRVPEPQWPNVYEDNEQGMHLAVSHLFERGHRRIGYLQVLSPSGYWGIDRYNGYVKACSEFGAEDDLSLACWLPVEIPQNGPKRILSWLRKEKPTALICGSYHAAAWLRELTVTGQLAIPRDLSVIVVDQCPFVDCLLGGVRPTTIELPLFEQGVTVAKKMRGWVQNACHDAESIAIPCRLAEGDSVAEIIENATDFWSVAIGLKL
ncbi:MAG: substrate-binding domain-containing protein [Planctomycetia bacterium]|nr:substrate-binding domain-containing protein [Planctomycetia bacterium]